MIDSSRITKVYSGRKGCACGCRGTYSYAVRYASQRPSYYEGSDGVSDRRVRAVAARVESLLREGDRVQRVIFNDDWIGVDLTTNQTYTLYFD